MYDIHQYVNRYESVAMCYRKSVIFFLCGALREAADEARCAGIIISQGAKTMLAVICSDRWLRE